MKTTLQPPSPARTARPHRRPPLIGWFTRFWLIVLAFALYMALLNKLATAEGRAFLWEKATTLLLAPETYIAFVVILVNSLIYYLVIGHYYPDARTTLPGLAAAVTAIKADEHHDSQPGELTHAFMIFAFPIVLILGGYSEYQWLRACLLPQ